MRKDKQKLKREEIIEKPGVLASKIVHNLLYDNDFNLYFIGNTAGNSLYTVVLNNEERVLASFTDCNILESYVNRRVISNILNKTFGKKIVCVKMNICSLYNLLHKDNEEIFENDNHIEEDKNSDVRTLIINPNNKDFFIPIHIKSTSDYIHNNDLLESNDKLDFLEQEDLRPLLYSKKFNRYIFKEEEEDIV